MPMHDSSAASCWIARRWQKLVGRWRGVRLTKGEKDTPPPTETVVVEELRTGWFITASCINCHLVLTSAYVLILFVQVLQSYTTRHGTSPPPLLDPGILAAFMLFAIFSIAYFAAIGYMALLLPNVPPWLWNTSVVAIYVQVIFLGLMSMTMIASSGSKLASHRNYMHLARAALPSFGVRFGEAGVVDEAAEAVMMGIARLAYVESLEMKKWQQIAQGLVALGGFALAVVYLGILVLLARRVAKELVQLRSSQGRARLVEQQQQMMRHQHQQQNQQQQQDREAAAAAAVRTWPPTAAAARYSMHASATPHDKGAVKTAAILQAARLDLPLRMSYAVRTPPLTPAPSGPLPLPPVDAEGASPRSISSHTSLPVGMSPRTRLSLPNTDPADSHRLRSPQQRHSMQLPACANSQASFPTRSDSYGRLDSPTDSFAESSSRLELAPRVRIDSDPNPWDLETLHEDLATHDGYTVVCRFLFNCIIDHVAVMLQCFFFGCHSVSSSPFATF